MGFASARDGLYPFLEEILGLRSAGLRDDYFADVAREHLAAGQGGQGLVGEAPSVLVEAAPICRFAPGWLEQRAG